ncbi:hypothetical protein NDN08_006960 [Rhodosorus marinus]|uniref:Transcription initiation factor TFIID subunit 9 n=1 Tax=Rhodosorus marinus TaxID=101924 RepID=A0AAV8UNA9_9RHOD|nr:hypothetical protein NDN08_006960 [Rhodosorus marinus]
MSGEEGPGDSSALGNDVPKDAQVMAAILKAMGVESYEDRVVNQLMELLYRYVREIIDEARGYCEYAGKKELGIEDVRLSIQSRISYSFTQPPSREVLLQLGRERNSIPLPPLEDKVGIQLPPEKHQLTSQNYQLKVESKAPPKQVEKPGTDPKPTPPSKTAPTKPATESSKPANPDAMQQ